MASKFNQKINAIFESKNVGFGSQNGTHMEPKCTPKSRKFVDISGYPPKTPPRRPNGGQGARKWSQNGAQREPNVGKMVVKASQNGPKIDEKRGPSVNPHLKWKWKYFQSFSNGFRWIFDGFSMNFQWSFLFERFLVASWRSQSWRILGNPSESWRILGNPSESWRSLGNPSESWRTLGNPNESWRILGNPSES